MKTRTFLCSLLVGMFLLEPPDSSAFREQHRPSLPDFDKRREQPSAAPTPEQRNAVAHLRGRLAGARVHFDDILGAPQTISAATGFLSGPAGRGRGLSPEVAARFAGGQPHAATKAFLEEHRALFGYGPEALVGARLKRDFVTPHNGLRTVVWEQEVDGIRVFGGHLISHTTRHGELAKFSSQFISGAAAAADAGTPNRRAREAHPPVTAQQAIAAAAQNIGGDAGELTVVSADTGAEQHHRLRGVGLTGHADAHLTWLPMNRGSLRICWEVMLTSRVHDERYHFVLDAETGEVLVRQCLTVHVSDATYRVFTAESPTPMLPGHAAPSSDQPPEATRALIVTSAVNTIASPLGWIADADNETRGNNVDVHVDRDWDGFPDLPRPQGSPFRVFDFPLDLGLAPVNSSDAALTQAFYWNNWMHDRLYELGFDEAAGNFQVDNFGRGGLGNDSIAVTVIDNWAGNNAGFTYTPVDGDAPGMMIMNWSGTTPNRNGALDATLLLHEYTHGLSNRRVGAGAGLGGVQALGMGEGWSDFYALAMLTDPSADLNGAYPVGAYVSAGLNGVLSENYYYGIRRYPTSTDLAKNPLTFRDIDPAHAGAPLSPLHSPFSAAQASEVHAIGEVWCVMLWEARANLILKHGPAVGNQLILQLVTDAMNLSPASPNFIQARDAIIQADMVNNSGANYPELWEAFAKRGLGASATSPSSVTVAGVQESFDVADVLTVAPRGTFASRGPVGGPFSVSARAYNLTNITATALTWSAKKTALWLNLSNTSGTLGAGGGTTLLASLNSTASLLPAGTYTDIITLSNHTDGMVQTLPVLLLVGQVDYFTELFDNNDNDLDLTCFTFTPDGSPSFYSVCRSNVTAFLSDPAGGSSTPTGSSGEMSTLLTIPGTNSVTLYGTRTNKCRISSYGHITFGSVMGDWGRAENLPQHFGRLRICGLWDELQPTSFKNVSYKFFSNRVAVTWKNVPETGTWNTNAFQIEMFFDGVIRLTYLRIDAKDGLVGLSRGTGLPANFVESDFSAFGTCGTPLTLTLPATATEGNGTLNNAGTVRIPTARSSNLTVTLTSSDTSEVTVPSSVSIRSGRTSATFNVTIVNDTLRDGSRTPFITASASGYVSQRAYITVRDNETARLVVTLPSSTTEGAPPLPGLVSMNATAGDVVFVNLTSSDATELQAPAIVIIPSGQTSAVFQASVVDDALVDGLQTATVNASVANWTNGAATVLVQDNDSGSGSFHAPPGGGGSSLGSEPLRLIVTYTGGSIVLCWPASATNAVLEFTEAFSPSSYWQPVTTPPLLDGAFYMVAEPALEPARFFRLRQAGP